MGSLRKNTTARRRLAETGGGVYAHRHYTTRSNAKLINRKTFDTLREVGEMRANLTEELIVAKLEGRPVQLVKMGRTVNDNYTFLCLADDTHGEWVAIGRNVLYLKSGCPACWDKRRRTSRKRNWRYK